MPRFQPEEILRRLEQHGVRYVVIGGVGATLHGSPLPTRYADICPAKDAKNLESLATALRELGARIRTAANREKDRQALPTLRLLLAKIRKTD